MEARWIKDGGKVMNIRVVKENLTENGSNVVAFCKLKKEEYQKKNMKDGYIFLEKGMPRV